MGLTSTQKILAVAAVLAIAAVLFVVFALLPQFQTIDSLNSELTDAQAAVQQAQPQLVQLRAAKSRAAQTEAQILQLGTEVPDSPQLPTLIIELEDMGAASGVDVVSMTWGPPAPVTGGQYTEIPLNLTLSAGWDDLLDYLRRIEKSTRLLRVSSVNIAPPSQAASSTAGTQVLTVTMQIKAYEIGTNGVLAPSGTPSATANTTTTP